LSPCRLLQLTDLGGPRFPAKICLIRFLRIYLRNMRKSAPLDPLFPKTRQQVLGALLLDPARSWYASDLARRLRVRPSTLQRELAGLVQAGVLLRRKDGNRVYYQADVESPLFPELRSLFLKTAGLADVVQQALKPLSGRIDVAFIYGSMARGQERSASDVDLMVIGTVGLSELSPALRKAEQRIGRPVNPSVFAADEVAKKLAAGHHFLSSVLSSERIFVVGSESALAAITGGEPRTRSRHEQTGA
jgi:predicted nucleotidyltransferase